MHQQMQIVQRSGVCTHNSSDTKLVFHANQFSSSLGIPVYPSSDSNYPELEQMPQAKGSVPLERPHLTCQSQVEAPQVTQAFV